MICEFSKVPGFGAGDPLEMKNSRSGTSVVITSDGRFWPVRISVSPGPLLTCRILWQVERRNSASMIRTLAPFPAKQSALFRVVVVFPSPAEALLKTIVLGGLFARESKRAVCKAR